MITLQNLSKTYKLTTGTSDSLKETLSNGVKSFLRGEWRSPQEQLFHALDDISLTIEAGDKVALLGKNGAGKSTLLKILSRITEPSKGFFRVKGRVASLLEVGTGFHPDLTGRENIFLNGAILGMSYREIKAKFDEIVAFADIEKFLDTPIKRYSSGMFMRLGFAIAAHLDAEVMIVDEVLAVGDAEFQKKCLQKMNEIGAQQRTILFVSHHLKSVFSLCNKGLLLEKGRLQHFGPIHECVEKYTARSSVDGKSHLVEGKSRVPSELFHRLVGVS